MQKILTFIVRDKKLLLLKRRCDPELKKSFWFTVTGARLDEETNILDDNLIETVKREVKEETNLTINRIVDLDWYFNYSSFGEDCQECAFISFANGGNIELNEEHDDYKWCDWDEFIDLISWPYGIVGNDISEKEILKDKIMSYVK